MRNLTRFRLCSHPFCCTGATVPRNRSKPNGWTLDPSGRMYCPRHAWVAALDPSAYLRGPKP